MTGTRGLIIDGRSGTGKTTLAARIARATGAIVVHMDDLYPGWHGLAAGSAYATEHVLEPLAAGRAPRWRRWDWHAGRRAEWHAIDAGVPFVLEGCGALSRANRALVGRAIWLELDEPARRARALARDGDDSWWDGWRAEEGAFIAAEEPASHKLCSGLTSQSAKKPKLVRFVEANDAPIERSGTATMTFLRPWL